MQELCTNTCRVDRQRWLALVPDELRSYDFDAKERAYLDSLVGNGVCNDGAGNTADAVGYAAGAELGQQRVVPRYGDYSISYFDDLALCALGTDCDDCGPRFKPLPYTDPVVHEVCENDCQPPGDGGFGYEWSLGVPPPMPPPLPNYPPTNILPDSTRPGGARRVARRVRPRALALLYVGNGYCDDGGPDSRYLQGESSRCAWSTAPIGPAHLLPAATVPPPDPPSPRVFAAAAAEVAAIEPAGAERAARTAAGASSHAAAECAARRRCPTTRRCRASWPRRRRRSRRAPGAAATSRALRRRPSPPQPGRRLVLSAVRGNWTEPSGDPVDALPDLRRRPRPPRML